MQEAPERIFFSASVICPQASSMPRRREGNEHCEHGPFPSRMGLVGKRLQLALDARKRAHAFHLWRRPIACSCWWELSHGRGKMCLNT